MLSYDIRALDDHAARVDGCLDATDSVWQEGDSLPRDGVRATGRLSKAGAGRYYWSGHISGTAELSCRRCLAAAVADVTDSVGIVFADADDEEVDDPDVYRVPPRAHAVDLREAIREQWLLTVPAYALCRSECRGLCRHCGADLNAGSCDCAQADSDSRWDALRTIRGQSR
jgi:uncharacterized protein